MKMEYKLTRKPDTEALLTLRASADAMARVMMIATRELTSLKLARAYVWIVAHIRYRTIKQVDGQWLVTYTFPLA